MLRFHAADFLRVMQQVESLAYENLVRPGMVNQEMIRLCLLELKAELNRAEIDWFDGMIERLLYDVRKGADVGIILPILRELREGIKDLFRKRHFLEIGPTEKRFYEENPFGQSAVDKFPSAKFDMVEAGKCYALDRWTASVFHLMRVLEVGLKTMAVKLEVFDPAKPSWESIIRRCETAIGEFSSDSHGQPWKQERDFYSEAATDFRFFKDPWRNHTSHVGDPSKGVDKYTKDEAQDILSHVKSFMEHLAKRFGEPGT